MAPPPLKVQFVGSLGDLLAAKLELPSGPIRAYALFAHCFSCSKDIFAAARISKALTEEGFAVLRFDFTGLGHSEGDFANTNFSSNVGDLIAAADFLREEYEAPKLLIGHSLGGSAVVMAAGSIPEVIGVATIGAPADPAHVTGHFEDSLQIIEEAGEALVQLGGKPFTIKQQFVDDLRSQKVLDQVANLKRPILIFHAPLDQVVGIDNATSLFVAARHPKSFVSLDNADHMVSRKEDAHFISTLLSGWIDRYLDEEPSEAAPRPQDGVVVVTETGLGNYSNSVLTDRHTLTTDEPTNMGGKDTGPSPYEYLTASLGACTSMTLRMYADLKQLPLERVRVSLVHEKKHAEDSAEASGKLDHITREIEIEGDLSEDQVARMLEIADKCPVHRTLHSPVIIETRLKS